MELEMAKFWGKVNKWIKMEFVGNFYTINKDQARFAEN